MQDMNAVLIKLKWKWLPSFKKNFYKSSVSIFKKIFNLLPSMLRLIMKNSIDIVKRMDYKKGDILLNIDAFIEYDKRTKSCSKEPETVFWIENFIKGGDVVFDIGANVGAYSFVIARHTNGRAKVYAFEPSFSTFAQLSRNVFLNNCDGVVIPMYVALSDRTGIATFNYSGIETGTALHALHALHASTDNAAFKSVYSQPILSYTIDDFIEQFNIPRPNHIKLDVDGIEYTILKGAQKTLSNNALRTIIVESEESRKGANEIEALLGEAGFTLHSAHLHNQNPLHKGPYVRNCIFVKGQ
jgi:FkbM family methyltransferase